MQKKDASSLTQTILFWLQDARYFCLSDELILSLPAFFEQKNGEGEEVDDQKTLEEKIVLLAKNLQNSGIHRLVVAPEKSAKVFSENITRLSLDAVLFFKEELAKHHISLVVEVKKNKEELNNSVNFFKQIKHYQYLYDALFFRQKDHECSLVQATEYEKTSAELDYLQQQISCDFLYCLETKDSFHAERQAEWLLKLAKDAAPCVTIVFDGLISLTDIQIIHPLCDRVATQRNVSHLTLCPSMCFEPFWQFEHFSHLIDMLPSQSVTSFLFKGRNLPVSNTLQELFFDAILQKISSKMSLDFCMEKWLIEHHNLANSDARKVRAIFFDILHLTKSQKAYSLKKNEKINKKQEACKILIDDLCNELRSLLSSFSLDNYVKTLSQL